MSLSLHLFLPHGGRSIPSLHTVVQTHFSLSLSPQHASPNNSGSNVASKIPVNGTTGPEESKVTTILYSFFLSIFFGFMSVKCILLKKTSLMSTGEFTFINMLQVSLFYTLVCIFQVNDDDHRQFPIENDSPKVEEILQSVS